MKVKSQEIDRKLLGRMFKIGENEYRITELALGIDGDTQIAFFNDRKHCFGGVFYSRRDEVLDIYVGGQEVEVIV